MELPGGTPRRILLLAEGRLVNLSAAEGHPAAVMDISFANHALAVEWLAHDRGKLSNRVHSVPADLDAEIAKLKLETMGIVMDEPTESAAGLSGLLDDRDLTPDARSECRGGPGRRLGLMGCAGLWLQVDASRRRNDPRKATRGR